MSKTGVEVGALHGGHKDFAPDGGQTSSSPAFVPSAIKKQNRNPVD